MLSVVSLFFLLAICLDLTRGQEFDTTNGRIRGKRISVLGKSLDVLYGIPFAKPPVGDLRFKHPEAPVSWSPEVKDVTIEMPSCIQSDTFFSAFPFDIFQTPNDYSEDCLYLNIWKPSSPNTGSNLAVMIWIYGGGFMIGSTRIPSYNGQYLAAEKDVIVVSINYRVGPLGFSFLGPDTIPGNMGMMDQVEAIKWVKNNIENFGGDRNRITLFGESAGAYSVGYHLLSPLTQDLFNNGIMQSGVPIHSITNTLVHKPTEARNNVRKLSEVMKCSGSSDADMYECLKAANPQEINTGVGQVSAMGVNFYPVVDGYYLPTDTLSMTKRGEYKRTNILTGATKDEMTLFYYAFLDPITKIFTFSGKEFNYQNYKSVLTLLTGLSDGKRLNALRYFYESEPSPPLDYLEILNHLSTDFLFKCPALKFSSLYTESNDVYLYSLNHRASTDPFPDWMGVPHGFDISLVFGRPLNDSLGFTEQDKELSRNIMTYWANFAKSGNPNTPEPVSANWPVFNKGNQTYMALDVGSNLTAKHGFRRFQCAFVNDILPMIPKDANIDKPVTPDPGTVCVNGSRQECSNLMFMVLLLAFLWLPWQ